MFDTYLFDLDGTLTDSHEGIINAIKYALGKMGEKIPPQETLLKFIGPPLPESYRTFLGFNEEKTLEGVRLYREYYSERGLFENRVYEGIPELLKSLKSAGKQLAVATSKPEPFTHRILEHFDLAKYFDIVTGSLPDGTRGTKGEVVACALESCGIADLSRAVMIGDRKHDIIGAKNNGIACIAVLYGFGGREEFESFGADFIVGEPMEILDI